MPTPATNPSSTGAERGLARLSGARLTSVQFVLDYLILGFDEKGALTTLVWPQVIEDGVPIVFGDERYRNKLCCLIEQRVETIRMEQDETINIRYDNGIEMRIPLQSYLGKGERAIRTGPNHHLHVF
jgi:hypothetical protein